MDCTRCHHPLPDRANFCPACGAATGRGDGVPAAGRDGPPADRGERLLQAIEYLPAAFSMYDPEERLYTFNQRLVEFFPEVRDAVRVGNSFENLARAAYVSGAARQDRASEELVRDRLKSFRNPAGPVDIPFADGRWIRALDHKTPDGWTICIRVDITNMKALEAELRASEAQLRNITDSVPAFIAYVGADMRYRFVNYAYEELLGRPRSQIVGRTLRDVWARLPAERHMPQVERALAGEETQYLLDVPDSRDEVRTVNVHYIPDRDISGTVRGFFSISVDITNIKALEAELRASEAQLRNITDSVPAFIAYVGADMRYRFVNRAYEHIRGLPRERIVGRTVMEIWSDIPTENYLPKVERALAGEKTKYLLDVPDKRGGIRTLDLHYIPDEDGTGAVRGYFTVSVDVTERQREERALKLSEEKFRNLAEGSIEAILVHRDGRPLFINRAYAHLYGYDAPDDLIELDLLETIVAPEDRERIRRYGQERVSGGSPPERYEFVGMRKDGERIWVDCVNSVIEWEGRPAILSTQVNITARKRAEAALQQSEERYRTLVEGSIQGLFVHRDFRVLFVNDELVRLLGYPSADALIEAGTTLNWVAPDDAERVESFARARYAGDNPPERYEHRVLREDGSIIWVESMSKRINWTDGPAVQTVFVDITERKLAEEMREAFVSMISHELKTPITSIMGATRALQVLEPGESGGPDHAELLEIVSRNSTRLLRLVDDVLDLQGLDSGQLRLKMERVDVGFAAAQVVEGSQLLARDQGVALRTDVPGNCWVHADPDRLQQVLANLVSNAIKYTVKGDTVRVSARRCGERVRISVLDHGPGIPESFRSRLFGRFQQVDKAASRKKGGTGLGLNIARTLVERMDGRIDYRSEPDVETEFFVELGAVGEAPARG